MTANKENVFFFTIICIYVIIKICILNRDIGEHMLHNAQGVKLLKLIDILRQETDELHPLRTSELCERLEAFGISCERRTLYKYISLLENYGIEIMKTRVGHEMGYYIIDRNFSVPELKIIIDAIQAAYFISEKKTGDLISKIAALGGSHQAELITGSIVRFNTRKHHNEAIYYVVDYLQQAVAQKKQISFLYFDLDENGNRIYRQDKKRYIAEPLALIYYEDNYYLVCYYEKHIDKKITYRIDRMDSVEVHEETISDSAIRHIEQSNMSEYTEQTFRMFGGAEKKITLEFDNSLIGAIFDKFGGNTKIKRVNDSSCSVTLKVQISPIFWGWIFQFGAMIEIVSPKSLRLEYIRLHSTVLKKYSSDIKQYVL